MSIWALRFGVGFGGVASIALALVTAGDSQAQSKAQRVNPLIEKLLSGGVATTPADWNFIDMEHGPYSIDKLQTILADMGKTRKANGQIGTAAIVRIPMDGDENSKFVVKQVLDSGAHGIVFPHIENKEQAARAIEAMRYPAQKGTKYPTPQGVRGYGPGRAATFWGLQVPEYIKRADVWPLNPDGELIAVMMIESAEGVKNAAEIMNTPGVGAVFIGASDLGMNLGVGPASPAIPPETEKANETVAAACKQAKVVCAYPVMNGKAEMDKKIGQGFRMLLVTGSALKE